MTTVFTPTDKMVTVSPGVLSVDKINKLYVGLKEYYSHCRYHYDQGYVTGIKLKREDYLAAKEATKAGYERTINELKLKIKQMEKVK